VLTTAVLQQRKSKDETAGPEPEKSNHGKWAEVSQHGFAAGLRLDMTGYSCPRSPCIAIEPAGDAELPADTAREDDSLKRVEEDGEKRYDADNGGKSSHQALMSEARE